MALNETTGYNVHRTHHENQSVLGGLNFSIWQKTSKQISHWIFMYGLPSRISQFFAQAVSILFYFQQQGNLLYYRTLTLAKRFTYTQI
jgi:hypothetical protein